MTTKDDWKALMPADYVDKYKDIDRTIQKTSEHVKANAGKYSEYDLKTIARIILKLRSSQKKIMWEYDFFSFVEHCFNDLQEKEETPDFHIEIYNAYIQFPRVCVICPRSHAKSSSLRIYLLHQILYGKVKFIIIIGPSQEKAAQSLDWIKDQLATNTEIQEVFGDLTSKVKWSSNEIVTSSGIVVLAKGAGQTIRGENRGSGRPDLIALDDLETDELVSTKEQRDKLSLWFRKAVLPAISRNGRVFIIGTILDMDSLLKNIQRNKIKDHIRWNVLFYKALIREKDGSERALWEKRKPLHELKILEKEDPETFSQEFQNDPRDSGMAVFHKDWYRYYDERLVRIVNFETFYGDEKLNTLCTTDFAASEKDGADFTVFMITGMDRFTNLYILEIVRIKTADPYEALEELIDLCLRWHCFDITAEAVIFSVLYAKMLDKIQDERGLVFNIIELKRSISKLIRIKSIASPIKRGNILWTEEMEELENELNAVTATKLGRHDDIADCLSDAWREQLEEMKEDMDREPVINSIEWALKQGYLPTMSEDQGLYENELVDAYNF